MPRPKSSTRLKSTVIAIVVGQAARDLTTKGAISIKTAKSLPTYSAVLPKYKVLSEQKIKLNGHQVTLRLKVYPPENYLVEAITEVDDVFNLALNDLRKKLLVVAEKKLRQLDIIENFKEEYTIFAISGYRGEPQQFLKYRQEIVGLIRSEGLPLSKNEVEETIQNSSLQYTAHDLCILDWDGAFCFDPKGNWHETIDLLEVANVHLLRLRVLDQELDRRLESMSQLLHKKPRLLFSSGAIRKQMAALMKLQAVSIEEFSHSGRDIQLIGDWYAAKLYTLIGRKFHLAEWQTTLREELNNLKALYQTAAEHFGVSAQTRAEFVEVTLWLLLAIGYIFIFYLDFKNAIG